MRNYLVVGLYRNGRIGDPDLLYPNGTQVYGTDGTPGVAYLDGFIAGKTQQSVLAERPWGPPAPDAGTDPVPTRVRLRRRARRRLTWMAERPL